MKKSSQQPGLSVTQPKPVFDKQEALLLPEGAEAWLTEMVLSLKRMTMDEDYRKEVGKRIS